MAKKSSYEEQRAAELAYAEEYRRRLRRSQSSSAPDEDELRRVEEAREAAERERAATVEEGRTAADARRRRTEELFGRTKHLSDPIELISEDEEWSSIVEPREETQFSEQAEKPDDVTEESASQEEPTSYRVSVEGVSIYHSLFIDGMSFDTDTVTPEIGETPKAGTRGRVYGRGIVYDEYGFDEESTPAVGESSYTSDLDLDGTADVTPDASEPLGRRAEDGGAAGYLKKGRVATEPVEYDGDVRAVEDMDSGHIEAEEYTAFLERERSTKGGVSNKTDPRDTYTPEFVAPDMVEDEPETTSHPISRMDEEEAMLTFERLSRERDKEIRASGKSGIGDEYVPEFALAASEAESLDAEPFAHDTKRREEDRRIDERELRREMERDMVEFVKREESAKRNKRTTPTSPDTADTRVEPPVYDKRVIVKRKKLECECDVALIEARFTSEIAKIEAERDKLEFTFGETDARDAREDKKNQKRLKELRAKLNNAKKFEIADNERYYLMVLTDLARAKVPASCDMERVIGLREKLIDLLARRDELNARLIELYLGRERGKKGGFEARAEEKRRARRKEFKKRSSLAGRIKREKVAYDYKNKLHELLNSQVELAGEIAECKYILRREKPKGEAAREVKKRLAELERDYRKNEKEIDRVSKIAFKKAKEKKEKKRGEVFGWIGLLILLAVIGLVIWQWENIAAFVKENIPNINDLMPPAGNPEDGDPNPDDGATDGGADDGTTGGGGADEGAESGSGDGTDIAGLYYIPEYNTYGGAL